MDDFGKQKGANLQQPSYCKIMCGKTVGFYSAYDSVNQKIHFFANLVTVAFERSTSFL